MSPHGRLFIVQSQLQLIGRRYRLTFITIMTCLQTASGPLPSKINGSGAIQTQSGRTLRYIIKNLTVSRDSWYFVLLFFIGLSAFLAMLSNGFRIHVLQQT
ncbi:hypothetical protein TNCT_515961 [Trichonephila clavata]|uniref:Uncharacterized protein n=1 Tax=Trichonephila clavata TaxID=2740835 RepID=A0A8X6KZ88_TRICU|nr:hypothetical protein TNCT_515961 [Trichonephila clavata]